MQKILVLAPHTDDGELGAGGFIKKLLEEGADVTYVAFSTAAESVPSHLPPNILEVEVKAATKRLGIPEENLIILNYQVRHLAEHRQSILEDLIKIRKKSQKFDCVIMPSMKDIHQDHTVIAQEGLRAFKNVSVIGYELIWNNLSFDTTMFVSLEERHIKAKISALEEYKSQNHRRYMSEEFIFALARTRGVQIDVEFAECFEVVRLLVE